MSADVDDLPQYSAKIRYLPTFSFFSTRGQKVGDAFAVIARICIHFRPLLQALSARHSLHAAGRWMR